MPFQLSPGVNVSEIDLTTGIPAVATSIGATAILAQWGPVEEVVTVGSEDDLVKRFWTPNNENAVSWYTAANFLAYGKNLKVSRAVSSAATNATASGTGLLIKNDDHYELNYANGQGEVGEFAAMYPGLLGNSLTVSIADSASFDSWDYKSEFDTSPGHNEFLMNKDTTSDPDTGNSNINDEIHVVVVDRLGLFSGVKGTVLERFPFLSKSPDAKTEAGASAYYAQVLNRQSQFVRWMDHPIDADGAPSTNWGTSFLGDDTITYTLLTTPLTLDLSGGNDGNGALTAADFINAFDMFADPDEIDVSLLLAGGDGPFVMSTGLDYTTVMARVARIASDRKDAVAFVSPLYADVVNNAGSETTSVLDTLRLGDNQMAMSHSQNSYAFADCNWKYQYDKYNDVYRWVPVNGDIAGLCAATDNTRDPWWSPAGFNRGNIKNVVRLAWNPKKADRDDLYKNSVNPVLNFPGDGTILYGDKTMLAKPSAFDRVNVRRLFIVLEKAIAISAKYSLFEFNDAFTRAQFVNMVEPFLRDVQGRRGIYDYRVVCDESNNTGEVIDRNEFVGDIYIKPAKSINFIQLNFVAVRTGVDFSEVVGKF